MELLMDKMDNKIQLEYLLVLNPVDYSYADKQNKV